MLEHFLNLRGESSALTSCHPMTPAVSQHQSEDENEDQQMLMHLAMDDEMEFHQHHVEQLGKSNSSSRRVFSIQPAG
eukprot:m.61964 g.61964  ORF g.61964 m.61964 type:complete len:77 (+) comp13370_c0_seq1:2514-2744(+)